GIAQTLSRKSRGRPMAAIKIILRIKKPSQKTGRAERNTAAARKLLTAKGNFLLDTELMREPQSGLLDAFNLFTVSLCIGSRLRKKSLLPIPWRNVYGPPLTRLQRQRTRDLLPHFLRGTVAVEAGDLKNG